MATEKQKLNMITKLIQDLSQVEDVDLLLKRILKEARCLVNADAGSIYIKDKNKLRFSCSQNDTLQKRLPAGKKLIYSSFAVPINHKSISGYVASTGEMLNIPDAHNIPKDVPYWFNKGYDKVSNYHTRSMLSFPLKTHRGTIVGVMQLINATNKKGVVAHFAKKSEPLIMHFANTATLAIERAKLTRALILRMIKMSEFIDPNETGAHVNRVASYAVEIYETWALKKGYAEEVVEKNKDVLKMAAMLHDVGKVAIPDKILKKPGRLEPDEYETMKQHTILGARLLADPYSAFDEAAYQVVLNHHEKWDGSGYPGHMNPFTEEPITGHECLNGKVRGKKGEEIPPFGRAVAIADVYDALSFRRVYKEAWEEPKVLETIKKESGKHFDPDMVEAFFQKLDVIRTIARCYPNDY